MEAGTLRRWASVANLMQAMNRVDHQCVVSPQWAPMKSRGYMAMPWRDRYSGGGRGFFGNAVYGARLDSTPPHGGFLGSVTVAHQDPHAAAREIERWAEYLHLVQVMMDPSAGSVRLAPVLPDTGVAALVVPEHDNSFLKLGSL